MSSPYFADVVLVVDELVAQLLLDVRRRCAELGHPVDHVLGEVEAVESLRTTMSKGVVVVPSSLYPRA